MFLFQMEVLGIELRSLYWQTKHFIIFGFMALSKNVLKIYLLFQREEGGVMAAAVGKCRKGVLLCL